MMQTFQLSHRGLIEIGVRYAVNWLVLATLTALLFRQTNGFALELGLFAALLVALLVYLVLQWINAYRSRWRISFLETKVELPRLGQTEIGSIESIRRVWRGPGQHCIMVKLRKGAGSLMKSTATVYPQYFERRSELEARLEALATHR